MTAEKWPVAMATLVLVAMASIPRADAGEPKPSVLFLGGIHADYAAKPLHAMGVELDACKPGQLAERLAAGKFNVVVAGVLNDADRKGAEDFLAKGGGVFVCNQESFPESKSFTATAEWLAGLGGASAGRFSRTRTRRMSRSISWAAASSGRATSRRRSMRACAAS